MFVEYIYKQYNFKMARRNTLKLNIPFQLKKQNTYRNRIDNLDSNSSTNLNNRMTKLFLNSSRGYILTHQIHHYKQ